MKGGEMIRAERISVVERIWQVGFVGTTTLTLKKDEKVII